MLDVHAPNESIHTWKSFFIHIAAIISLLSGEHASSLRAPT